MNTHHPFEQRLADWLEDGPADAPDQILETVLAAVPSIPQRRAALRVPRRNASMNGYARVLAGIAAVVAIAVGALILRPGSSSNGVGAAPSESPAPAVSPSSTPSPEAQATVPIAWTTYTSSRFAYTIDYPTDWGATLATMDWPSVGFPDTDSKQVDNFGPRPFGTQLVVSSVPLSAGKDAAEWIAGLDTRSASFCTELSDRLSINLDGVTARQEEQFCVQAYHVIEVASTSGGRFYLIEFVSAGPEFTDTDRAIFDRVLASFRFGG